MTEYIQLKNSDCKNCYKCIRFCPVKSIRFSESKANIINEDCILCGNCYVSCPQNAKEIRNDIKAAKELIRSGKPVFASIAPSFVVNYKNASAKTMENALIKLGFAGAEETAIGAEIVKKHYDKMVMDAKQDVIISSCCHSVNLLIQKHYPKAAGCLAHTISPMQAHSKDIKRRNPGCKTIFIGPCISKKAEAETYKDGPDCVLTFEELTEWFFEERITLEKAEDSSKRGFTRLFPTTGGILRTMEAANSDYTYMAIDGIENCVKAVKDILEGSLTKCFIEMSACVGSCINGPILDKKQSEPVRDYILINNYAGKEDFGAEPLSDAGMEKDMPPLVTKTINITDSAIEEALKKIGKTKPEHELNCGGCGYNTCREKARAVLMGKADLTMCLPHLKEKAESFSENIISNSPNAIIVLNDAFEIQQINTAACNMFGISDQSVILGNQVIHILDLLPFDEARESKKRVHVRSAYIAEYKKYVEQTVIYDEDYHIFICIMRDITEDALQRVRKEEFNQATIDIADKVIEKQMRIVQEIASLLGETTAETKIALTKLKESLRNE